MIIDYNIPLTNSISSFLKTTYKVDVKAFEFQTTKKDFDGDITLQVFPLLKLIKTNPEILADGIGEYLLKTNEIVTTYNTVKGFLNITLSDNYYLDQFRSIYKQVNYGHKIATKNALEIMVEFSSPNTNKPLHMGHIRNNVLGYSVAKLLEANGNEVIKTQIINDRGIHI